MAGSLEMLSRAVRLAKSRAGEMLGLFLLGVNSLVCSLCSAQPIGAGSTINI